MSENIENRVNGIEKGSVSIDAENIMPVIKRWLYSDKDIFIREAVSNGCDAITKYRMLNPGTEEPMEVLVTVDKEKKEIRFDDTGIGMTADEVRRYINQVAFSSAAEFMKQVAKDEQEGSGGIIGHFGLGFYSVFMVSEKVEIESLSCLEGADPVHWVSEDGMHFEMGPGSRTQHGTTIILHVSEEEKEFLDVWRVRGVLNRYCGWMAVPVKLFDANAKPTEREETVEGETDADGKPVTRKVTEEPKPEQINDTNPLWLRKPADCTDEEYKAFYHKVFTDPQDPLFWVHLNVDYPFNLKGILFFPKLPEDFGVREGEIKLFSGQVFVADNIKEIIPEFLMLLRGVIDCPDIPLNVSRSFLQNDGSVKKISGHITKKVADKLTGLFNTARQEYEGYWDDIAPFVRYGCMTDQKFYEQMKPALLYHLTDGGYQTLQEYRDESGQKTEGKVLYTSDAKRQAASVALYTGRGIRVAVLDYPKLDAAFLNFMEYSGGEDAHFVRVDADVSGLTEKEEQEKPEESLDQEKLQSLFRGALGQEELEVSLAAMADEELMAVVTEDEQMRRFREVYAMKGMDGLGGKRSLVLNRRSAAVQRLAAMDPESETAKLLAAQMYDLARMAVSPLEGEEITAFLNRSAKLVARVAEEK
ncbi:MAG: molecular chaperone HtpG [Clostridia bacterium]|nr:molecular chaperone HtpG [Clostridia bacterium]MBQ6177855.1 molecular chaperone HtpG [Bacteroidales bacterium]MBR4459636.1 molecular chaperone HtpG [Clostridia bacterium]